MQPRYPILGLVMVSAGALAFEISLARLFAIQQFHHFAFVVVSLAVMGSAASGVLLTARPRHPSLSHLATALAASIVLAYLIINFLPFDSYTLAWDAREIGVLCLYFFAAGLPFVFAGWVAGACLVSAGVDVHRPYAANLAGSGLGSLGAIVMLNWLEPPGLVFLAAGFALFGAVCFSGRSTLRLGVALLGILAVLAAARPPLALALRLSPYKPLSVAKLAPDARTTLTLWSSSTRLDAVESGSIHVLPGLSLNATVPLPPQAAVFLDGEGPLPITSLSPDEPQAASLAERTPVGLAYSLRPGARALILEPGAGLEALLALAAGAEHVTVAEDEPLIVQALTGPYGSFSRNLLLDPRLTILGRTSRGALRTGIDSYDIVQFALSDGYHPITSGAFSLTEDYTLTVDAFSDAYMRLDASGLLVITRWLQTPPSESARAFATLLAALDRFGTSDLQDYLIAFRSMRTATLIVSRRPFTAEEMALTRAYLEANGFDPIVMPGLTPSELNRHNRLPSDDYHSLYMSLLNDMDGTIASYDFNLRPPTDDRPFFFHFFQWRQTPQVLARLGQTWQPFGGSGYLVLLALLGLMAALAIPLALAPLVIHKRRRGDSTRRERPANETGNRSQAATLAYFAFLGAGYMLVEVPLIQRLTLLLDRPALSLAAVLFTLLLASGAGSLISPRFSLRPALAGLVACLGLTIALVPPVVRIALPWDLPARLAVAVLLLLPIGSLMGIPFAAGLRRLEGRSPGLIPWAWAVNGAVSGVSGVLAALVALDWGFTAVMGLGALAYAGALVTAPRQS